MSKAKRNFAKEKNQLLETLLQQAKKKGYINSATIIKKFARYRIKENEKEDIFLQFEKAGVQIVYPEALTDSFLDANEEPDLIEENDITVPDEDIEAVNPIQQYLKEIHPFPTLSYKETLQLVGRIQNGDEKAREWLVNCNLKFAFTIAMKYARTGMPVLDLVQQANLGLMAAVDRYNPHRGTKFTTYAVFWIKQSILNYLEDQSRLIKMPSYIVTALKKLNAVQSEYYDEHQKYPSDDEIATLTGFTIAHVKHLMTLEYSIASLDAPVNDEMDGTLLDTIKDEDGAEPDENITVTERNKSILSFVEQLEHNQRKVITLRYGLYNGKRMNLEEVAGIMNLSIERVRQIESMALNNLRKMPKITSLHIYMD